MNAVTQTPNGEPLETGELCTDEEGAEQDAASAEAANDEISTVRSVFAYYSYNGHSDRF